MSNDLLQFAIETATGAGSIIRSHYGSISEWRTKEGRGDIVTEVDTESEDFIVARINEAFPSHNIVAEESGKITVSDDSPYTWFIDPLDGTRNYAMRIPFFCTTLAVAKGGEVVAGVTYDPMRDELYKAALGEGAYLNETRLSISPDSDIDDALISIGWSRRRPGSEQFPEYVRRLSEHTSFLRRFGSAALAIAYVAAGKIDAYIQGAITPWDIAAGILLVTEAGGRATDIQGNPVDLSRQYSDIIAANNALHAKLLKEILVADSSPGA